MNVREYINQRMWMQVMIILGIGATLLFYGKQLTILTCEYEMDTVPVCLYVMSIILYTIPGIVCLIVGLIVSVSCSKDFFDW